MKRVKPIIISFYGYTIAWGLSIILFYIWICAWLNNNKVTITINNHNEAIIELILFPITILFITTGLIIYSKGIKKK